MGRGGGGTQIYCPECHEIQVCRAIPTTKLGLPSGQRWHRIGHGDINWFRRGRECLACGNEFTTAELDEDFVDELVELRNALRQIKRNAERYVESASEAATALDDLTQSLDILRSLQIYRHQA
jgi:hypothetical protein